MHARAHTRLLEGSAFLGPHALLLAMLHDNIVKLDVDTEDGGRYITLLVQVKSLMTICKTSNQWFWRPENADNGRRSSMKCNEKQQ